MLDFKVNQSLYRQRNQTTPLRSKFHLTCNSNALLAMSKQKAKQKVRPIEVGVQKTNKAK